MPGGENLQKISTVFRISVDWLLTGEGEMKRGYIPHDVGHQAVAESPGIYNDKELAEIIDILQRDLPEAKGAVLKILKARKELKAGMENLLNVNKITEEGENGG